MLLELSNGPRHDVASAARVRTTGRNMAVWDDAARAARLRERDVA
jgi:hypothetical protein